MTKQPLIKTTEYSGMEFNPTVKKDLIVEYPKLKDIFSDISDKEMRYLLLVYDRNSPLKKYYPNLKKRKEFAAATAGYDTEVDNLVPIFDFTIEEVTPAVIEDGEEIESEKTQTVVYTALIKSLSSFLSYQNSRLWAMIVTNEQAFYEYQEKVMSSVVISDDKDALSAISIKTKLLEAMDAIHKRLDAYYSEFTGDDTSVQSAISKRRITAEGIAGV